MRFLTLLIPILGAGSALAHHMATNIWIDGVNQGAGTCMRIPRNTDPVTNVYSEDMACNVGRNKQEAITCAANAGSRVTVQWRIWPDGSNDGPIDPSHQGPCAVYMKRMGLGGSGAVAGGGWFKIWHDGFRDGAFCTERLRRNGNKMDFSIPSNLAGGYYTLRAESLALHQGGKPGGAQWYIGCAQLFVYSTGGNSQPTDTVSIPGYVDPYHKGVLFNYWLNKTPSNYQIPGPEPRFSIVSSPGKSPIKVPFKPHNYGECVVKNANWCAVSPPRFTDTPGCWASSKNCWDQLDTCYRTAPVTGNSGCREWEKTCTKLQALCHSCRWHGTCNGGSKTKRSILEDRHGRFEKIKAHVAANKA
ncbi:family 61 glycoside hydrolase [Pyronema domesticum]|uniref:AA9 family lytic polysaccharide monooxygenase n=1 Tax=Pyronema omphalodes (strain CBS 100304) TaxID=1076935 RepID=U4KTT6_PYROM|nr:family 61 glycoside hydrolase [Pyronema domesticum]CCX04393.1 Similar to Probable endo-beta-1,4-glucanase D; acc. no. Q2US83 [Pyronema omphalodes CBS 100304]